MGLIQIGPPLVFGVHLPKKLIGFPRGKTRLRMRNDQFLRVRVMTKDGIREFAAIDSGDYWICSYELGRNKSQ